MGIPFAQVKAAHCLAEAHGVAIDWDQLVTQKLAGGDLDSLVRGMIYAKKRGVKMSTRCACACNLLVRAEHRISLSDWLKPVIDSGVTDMDNRRFGPPPDPRMG